MITVIYDPKQSTEDVLRLHFRTLTNGEIRCDAVDERGRYVYSIFIIQKNGKIIRLQLSPEFKRRYPHLSLSPDGNYLACITSMEINHD